MPERSGGGPTPEAVRDAWNRLTRPPLPRCRHLTAARRAAARQRLKEYTLADIEAAIARIAASPFCRGGGRRGWVAGIDFLLRPNTVARALEGAFDAPGGREHGRLLGARPDADYDAGLERTEP